MVDTLRTTGSDFAVGSRATVHATTRSRRPAGRAPCTGPTGSAPPSTSSPPRCRTSSPATGCSGPSSGARRSAAFRGHIAYEDHVPMLTAYVRADAVRHPVPGHLQLADPRGQDLHRPAEAQVENLLDRIAVKEEAHEMLLKRGVRRSSTTPGSPARIEVDFPAFIAPRMAGDDLYRNVLDGGVPHLLRPGQRRSAAGRALLPEDPRLAGRRGPVEPTSSVAQAYFREAAQLPPSTVVDGRIVAVVPEHYEFPGTSRHGSASSASTRPPSRPVLGAGAVGRCDTCTSPAGH